MLTIRARYIVATLLFVVSVCASARSEPRSLRFDGMYVAATRECTDYFRFYADGSLVHACSTGNPQQVAKWLHKGYSTLGDAFGAYELRGEQLVARVAVHRGEPGHTGNLWFRYRGRVGPDELVLQLHHPKTGPGETLRYRFLKIALPPDQA